MFGIISQRHFTWLFAAACLAGPVANAFAGGPARTPKHSTTPARGSEEAQRLEQARRANAQYLRNPRPERPVPVSAWRPADATQFVPSGEYLSKEELAQRETLRRKQAEHVLTSTVAARAGVHEAR